MVCYIYIYKSLFFCYLFCYFFFFLSSIKCVLGVDIYNSYISLKKHFFFCGLVVVAAGGRAWVSRQTELGALTLFFGVWAGDCVRAGMQTGREEQPA